MTAAEPSPSSSAPAASAAQARFGACPPRPRVSLRVGVSGHRALPETTEAALGSAIEDALGVIAEAAEALRTKHWAVFSAAPAELHLVTPAAEGADTVAGEAALRAGWRIDCPLPFAPAEYEKDLNTSQALERHRALIAAAEGRVFALDGARAAQSRAYEAVGLFVLRRSDLLIGVWDGEDAAGRGGTMEMLRAAYAAGLPILWFSPEGAGPKLVWMTEGAPPDLRDAARIAKDADAKTITDVVDWIVAPPAGSAGEHLRRYLAVESQPRARRLWAGFTWLEVLAGARPLKKALRAGHVDKLGAESEAYWASTYWSRTAPIDAEDPALARAIREVVFARYVWADDLAVHLAQIYRSAYVYIFGMGALAVLLALLGVFERLHDVKPALVLIELGILIVMGIIVYRGGRRRRDWHRRFLEYRQLAEHLRPWRVLAHTGGATPAMRTPKKLGEAVEDENWIGWYLRAAVRELPMPAGRASPERVRALRDTLIAAEIKEQINYQNDAAARSHRLDEHLDWVGLAAFFFTALICGGYFFWAVALNPHPPGEEPSALNAHIAAAVTFATALLPAIGSALLGIRVQGDFGAAASRAKLMKARLAHLEERFRTDAAPTFAAVARMAEDSAEAMAAEVANWAFVYRAKPLTLPG